jgi:hypothetical protein
MLYSPGFAMSKGKNTSNSDTDNILLEIL